MTTKYSLTDEHRAQLGPWADKWIQNAMSTAPMTSDDLATLQRAIRGLYAAAGIAPPPDRRIIVVPSPIAMAFAGGIAAAWWHLCATRDATLAIAAATLTATDAAITAATRAIADAKFAATFDATSAATLAIADATDAAIADATLDAADATDAATRDAITAATRAIADATLAATLDAAIDDTDETIADAMLDATDAATDAATWYRITPMAPVAQRILGHNAAFGLSCVRKSWRMRHGGNHWSGWVAYLSFFRHIAKLPLDYTAWAHYETAAQFGQRIMHREFCIVSERPELLTVDDRNRPHAENGPFCRWRDGTALYAWHGVRVPWDVIERPESITAERIENETNAEVRRVMIERFVGD